MNTIQHISDSEGTTLDSFSSENAVADSGVSPESVLEQVLNKHDASEFQPAIGLYKYTGTKGNLLKGQIVKGVFLTKGVDIHLWYMTKDDNSTIYNAPASDFQKYIETGTGNNTRINSNGVNKPSLYSSENAGEGAGNHTQMNSNGGKWINFSEMQSGDDGTTTGGNWWDSVIPPTTNTTTTTPPAVTQTTSTTSGNSSSFWSTLGSDFTSSLPGLLKSAQGTTIGTGTVQVTPTPIYPPTSSSGNSTVIVIVVGVLIIGGVITYALLKHKKNITTA